MRHKFHTKRTWLSVLDLMIGYLFISFVLLWGWLMDWVVFKPIMVFQSLPEEGSLKERIDSLLKKARKTTETSELG
jgi:hypothetical protein